MKEPDSLKRLIYMTAYNASTYFLIKGRTGKPFNPLLGETYDFVTKNFRFFAEQVSHHPPVCAINCQGNNWELLKMVHTNIKFNGRQVTVVDNNPTMVDIFPECLKDQMIDKESYVLNTPKMHVGNIVVGERYVEPGGKILVENLMNGETCELDFKQRGFMHTSADKLNAVEGVIKDCSGIAKYKVVGKFTEKLEAINLETDERWTIFEAPTLPPNAKQMFGFNYYTLQLNDLTDKIQEKLPPTDSRLRMDVRYWEENELSEATNEKNRLEHNQRERRKQVKESLIR